MPAKRLLAALLILSPATSLPRSHDTPWLTVVGDAGNPDADTILIDPRPVAMKGHQRWMNLRLNRARHRTSTDGVGFRSFTAEVEFDCQKMSARFTRTQFYGGPLWTAPGSLMVYPPTMVRPMVFRDFEPNPREKVIHAACSLRPAGGQ